MSKSRKTFDSIGETCFDRLRISHHSSHADSDYEPDSEADINTDSDTSLDLELESKLAKIKTSRRSSTCSVHQYACSVAGCFAIFTKRYRLDRHQRKHSGEVIFVDFVCCNLVTFNRTLHMFFVHFNRNHLFAMSKDAKKRSLVDRI